MSLENIKNQQDKFRAIADKIRNRTGETGIIPNTFDDKIDEVYEAGKIAQCNAFWDNFLLNETLFNTAFAYRWNDEIFKLDRKIQPTNANGIFRQSSITDLQQYSDLIDFSRCGDIDYGFYDCKLLKKIGVVDTRAYNKDIINLVFFGCPVLESIDEFILKEDGSQTLKNCFNSCNFLKDIKISGTIGCEFDIRYSPLSKASFISIINALSNTVGNTVTFRRQYVINAFGSVDAAEWIELITPKSNQYNGLWTISLI